MTRFAHMVVLATFLAIGFGVPMTFANEPAPAEQKDQKGQKGRRLWAASKPLFGGTADAVLRLLRGNIFGRQPVSSSLEPAGFTVDHSNSTQSL